MLYQPFNASYSALTQLCNVTYLRITDRMYSSFHEMFFHLDVSKERASRGSIELWTEVFISARAHRWSALRLRLVRRQLLITSKLGFGTDVDTSSRPERAKRNRHYRTPPHPHHRFANLFPSIKLIDRRDPFAKTGFGGNRKLINPTCRPLGRLFLASNVILRSTCRGPESRRTTDLPLSTLSTLSTTTRRSLSIASGSSNLLLVRSRPLSDSLVVWP